MGLVAKATGGSDYEPIPAGQYQAACLWVVDLGTHYNVAYDKRARKVLIGWEIPEVRIEIEKDGEKKNLPRMLSKTYTLSLHEKSTLRKELEMWRGKTFTEQELEGFDLSKLIGVNCMLQIIHKQVGEKTYANIVSITPLYKGLTKIGLEGAGITYSMDDDPEIPAGLPGWVVKKIEESEESAGSAREPEGSNHQPTDDPPPPTDDDIPF